MIDVSEYSFTGCYWKRRLTTTNVIICLHLRSTSTRSPRLSEIGILQTSPSLRDPKPREMMTPLGWSCIRSLLENLPSPDLRCLPQQQHVITSKMISLMWNARYWGKGNCCMAYSRPPGSAISECAPSMGRLIYT